MADEVPTETASCAMSGNERPSEGSLPEIDLETLLDLEFSFVRQPDPLSASLRPQRRVPLLLLLLAKSRGRKLSWKGIHLLNWATRDSRSMELLAHIDSGLDIPDLPIVRIEPAMDRAIDLALGIGYVSQAQGRVFSLTPLGVSAASDIESTQAFKQERAQLNRLRGKVTQAQVDRLLEWRLR